MFRWILVPERDFLFASQSVLNIYTCDAKKFFYFFKKIVDIIAYIIYNIGKERERYRKMENILIYLFDKYDGKWEDIYDAIVRKEMVDRQQADKVAEDYRKVYNVTTIISEDYPVEYKSVYKPPFVILSVKGGIC